MFCIFVFYFRFLYQIRAAHVPIARSAPVQIRHTVTENGAHIIQPNGKLF